MGPLLAVSEALQPILCCRVTVIEGPCKAWHQDGQAMCRLPTVRGGRTNSCSKGASPMGYRGLGVWRHGTGNSCGFFACSMTCPLCSTRAMGRLLLSRTKPGSSSVGLQGRLGTYTGDNCQVAQTLQNACRC